MPYDYASENFVLLRRTIKGTLDFSGRSRRTEVLYYVIATALINVVVSFVTSLEFSWAAMQIIQLVLGLTLSVPHFALFARRLHDQNRSGWWAMILPVITVLDITESLRLIALEPSAALVPSSPAVTWIGPPLVIAYLVLTFIPGTNGDNRFGADPRLA